MPIYEYRCERGHTFEIMQRMVEDPLDTCQSCDAPAQRVLHPVAVHFKGKGFYNTDYGTRKRNREMKASADSSGDSGSKKSDSASSSAKSETTSTSSAAAA